eukprot:scaffold1268_cov39-Attheya_sp.AAC.2
MLRGGMAIFGATSLRLLVLAFCMTIFVGAFVAPRSTCTCISASQRWSFKDDDEPIVQRPSLDGKKKDPFYSVTIMEKLNQVEEDMKHNQDHFKEMMNTLEHDLKMQQMLRHEATAANDRLTFVQNKLERKLRIERQEYAEEKAKLVQDHRDILSTRDSLIQQYEKERGKT